MSFVSSSFEDFLEAFKKRHPLWVCMKSEDDDSKGGADERDITVSKRTD